MKNSDLTKLIMTVVAIAALAVPCVSNAQVSKLSERDKGLIYSRAFEAILWASPLLAVYAQAEAGTRDLGAGPLDIVYTGVKPDYRWGAVTVNNNSPYFMNYFSLKDGPVVVEIPAATPGARAFGSIHDAWMIPLEDFGPAGADKGKGGKYLVLPPGYDGEVPEGYIVLRSNSYLHWIPGRTIPGDKGQKGWDDAVAYLQTVRIYPLSEAANPRPTKFVQGAQRKYDGQPMFDLSDFYLLDRAVQTEPIREHDKIMYGMLATVGIRKGQKFDPTPEVAAILERAAKDAQDYVIGHMQSGESFMQFWEGSAWGGFKLSLEEFKTYGSFNLDDGLMYQDRIVRWFYFSGGYYRSWDPLKPAVNYYLMTARDRDGKVLEGSKTYKVHVPANPPMKDFWSLIAYGLKSRTFINSPKSTVTSADEGVVMNDDGSIDLYLSPKSVKGYEANTLITSPEEPAFLMFRFYGAKPVLWEKKWKLGDPELAQ